MERQLLLQQQAKSEGHGTGNDDEFDDDDLQILFVREAWVFPKKQLVVIFLMGPEVNVTRLLKKLVTINLYLKFLSTSH